MEGAKENKKMNWGYPILVWLTTNLLPVMLIMAIEYNHEPFAIGILVFVWSLMLSTPSLILSAWLCRRLAKSNLPTATAKIWIWISTFGFIIATFGILALVLPLTKKDSTKAFSAITAYSVSAAAGAAFFQLREGKTEIGETV